MSQLQAAPAAAVTHDGLLLQAPGRLSCCSALSQAVCYHPVQHTPAAASLYYINPMHHRTCSTPHPTVSRPTCLGSACRAAAACLCAAFAASIASCSFVEPGWNLGGGLGFTAAGTGSGCGSGFGQGCESLNSCGTVGAGFWRRAGLLHVLLRLPMLASCKQQVTAVCVRVLAFGSSLRRG
jgi:hypothetical protein